MNTTKPFVNIKSMKCFGLKKKKNKHMQNDQYHTKWHYQTHAKCPEMSRVIEENDPLILNHKFSVMKTRKKVRVTK